MDDPFLTQVFQNLIKKSEKNQFNTRKAIWDSPMNFTCVCNLCSEYYWGDPWSHIQEKETCNKSQELLHLDVGFAIHLSSSPGRILLHNIGTKDIIRDLYELSIFTFSWILSITIVLFVSKSYGCIRLSRKWSYNVISYVNNWTESIQVHNNL